jgi:hypothetical protein
MYCETGFLQSFLIPKYKTGLFLSKAVMEFFETSGQNLLAAEAAAGVWHHVALSIVRYRDSTLFYGVLTPYNLYQIRTSFLVAAGYIPFTVNGLRKWHVCY